MQRYEEEETGGQKAWSPADSEELAEQTGPALCFKQHNQEHQVLSLPSVLLRNPAKDCRLQGGLAPTKTVSRKFKITNIYGKFPFLYWCQSAVTWQSPCSATKPLPGTHSKLSVPADTALGFCFLVENEAKKSENRLVQAIWKKTKLCMVNSLGD